MAKVCIVCHNEKNGRSVADDAVIRTIRRVKNSLGIATNNKLVVCDGCMGAHEEKRKKYERELAMHLVLGGLALLLFILLPIFTGGFSLMSVFLGLVLFLFITALSVLQYSPKLEEQDAGNNATGAKKAEHAAKKKAAAGRKK